MPPATQIRQIKVNVSTGGDAELKKIANSLSGVQQNTKTLADGFSFLKDAFLGYLAVLQVKRIADISDSMQLLFQRLTSVTGSTQGAQEALNGLEGVASRTHGSIVALGNVYAQLGTTLKITGANSTELLQLTEVLENTFRLSGKSSEDAAASINALAFAFAQGGIKGRQLRSVLNENSELFKLFQEKFGADLFKDAQKGIFGTKELLQILADNQDKVNTKAGALAQTFGQVLTNQTNKFSEKVFELNQKLSLADGLGYILDKITDKLGLLGIALGVLALTQVPALTGAVKKLAIAFDVFAASNPITASLVAISLITLAVIKNFNDLEALFKRIGAGILGQLADDFEKLDSLTRAFARFAHLPEAKQDTKFVDSLRDKSDRLLDSAEALKKADAELKVVPPAPKGALGGLAAKAPNTPDVRKIKDVLGELNDQYIAGKINAEQYAGALDKFNVYKLTREFHEGKIELEKYREGLLKIEQTDIVRLFNQGAIGLRLFNDLIRQNQVQTLDDQLQSGKIDLIAYNQELTKITDKLETGNLFITGTSEYLKTIGNVAQNIADGIKNAFGSLETAFTDFIKTGKLDFAKFTQSILDDIAKIIVRASIVQPLANGILSAFLPSTGKGTYAGSFGDTPSLGTKAATGQAFNQGNIQKFATGGLVSSPTLFGFGGGKTGLMGEAGTEAILPLKRGAGGNLGVHATVTPVNVNINNYSNASVEQKETTDSNGQRQIELVIRNVMKDQIAAGAFDKPLASSYGLKRKGQ